MTEAKRFCEDQQGIGYSISYLLTLPVYVLFIALFFEFSMILVATGGAHYSAFAACRTAIVWDSDNDAGQVDDYVDSVAKRAFTPFAAGLAELRRQPASTGDPSEEEFLEQYEAYSQEIGIEDTLTGYVAAKYRQADRKVLTSVERQTGEAAWDRDITVAVSYSYPFSTLGIGRVVGERDSEGKFVYPVKASVTLKSELPRNETTSLGIEYGQLP